MYGAGLGTERSWPQCSWMGSQPAPWRAPSLGWLLRGVLDWGQGSWLLCPALPAHCIHGAAGEGTWPCMRCLPVVKGQFQIDSASGEWALILKGNLQHTHNSPPLESPGPLASYSEFCLCGSSPALELWLFPFPGKLARGRMVGWAMTSNTKAMISTHPLHPLPPP